MAQTEFEKWVSGLSREEVYLSLTYDKPDENRLISFKNLGILEIIIFFGLAAFFGIGYFPN